MRKALAILLALALTGCGTLIPKRVELGQDKVEKVPVASATELEKQRRAAAMAEEQANKTLEAAIGVDAPVCVTEPAKATVDLTDAVAKSVGPPKNPIQPNEDPHKVANDLRSAIAKLNARLDDFKADNDKNAGKKIEGTGWLQVPYFIWLGGFLLVAFVGLVLFGVAWSFVKMYAMSNPPVQLGVNAVQMGANFLKKAVGEITKGGERFKQAVEREVQDPALQARIKELFRVEHERAQSSEVQELVKAITPKESK
jgi:hypothetical protein